MSLFRTAARAAVATRVIGATHRRQQQQWAAQDAAAVAQAQAQAPAAPPAAPVPPAAPAPAAPPAAAPAAPPAPAPGATSTASMIEQLTQLGQLRDAGVLTDAEFEAQKQRILAG